MQLVSVRYEPKFRVSFTPDEIVAMVEAAERHYDGACRALAKQGGALYGLGNKILLGGTAEWEFSRCEVDLLCKAMENIVSGVPCVVGPLLNAFHGLKELLALRQVRRPYPRTAPCAVECRGDGNQVGALIGPNIQEGVCGFGDDLPSALRALANELEIEVGETPEVSAPAKPTDL